MNIIEAISDPKVFGPAFRDRAHGRMARVPRCLVRLADGRESSSASSPSARAASSATAPRS